MKYCACGSLVVDEKCTNKKCPYHIPWAKRDTKVIVVDGRKDLQNAIKTFINLPPKEESEENIRKIFESHHERKEEKYRKRGHNW